MVNQKIHKLIPTIDLLNTEKHLNTCVKRTWKIKIKFNIFVSEVKALCARRLCLHEYIYEYIYESKGRNVAIELVGNPIYQGANDTYYNVDQNGTKHPPQPQIWSCKDIYLTLTLGDIKWRMNGEPEYSQIDPNNRPLEYWVLTN